MTILTDKMDSQQRKDHPLFSGVLAYFPDALLEVAELSRIANEKHNPGQPLHWSKGKSNDHADALVRHQLDAGKWDNLEGYRVRHSAEVAWRALAQLQTEIENEQKPDGSHGTKITVPINTDFLPDAIPAKSSHGYEPVLEAADDPWPDEPPFDARAGLATYQTQKDGKATFHNGRPVLK